MIFDRDFSTAAAFVDQFIQLAGTFSTSNQSFAWRGFEAGNTIAYSTRPFGASAATFQADTDFVTTATAASLASLFAGFIANPGWNYNAGSGAGTHDNFVGFAANLRVNPPPSGGAGTIQNLTGFQIFKTIAGEKIGANNTVDTYRGLWVGQPSKNAAATVTTQVGVEIDSLSNGSTNLSLRSVGTQHMRHQGDACIGANAGANTGIDCAKDIAYRPTARTLANGTNNDVNATDTSVLRITGPTAAFTITGFSDPQQGKWLLVINTTTQAMTIAHENAGSTAANRIILIPAVNLVLAGSVSYALFWYDVTTARWRLIAARDSGGPR